MFRQVGRDTGELIPKNTEYSGSARVSIVHEAVSIHHQYGSPVPKDMDVGNDLLVAKSAPVNNEPLVVTALPLLVDILSKNRQLVKNSHGLAHIKVLVTAMDAENSRPKEAVLLVENKQLNIQNLAEDNKWLWIFSDQDLSNFVFDGNAYQASVFLNTNLTNADLSKMEMKGVTFDAGTILKGTKFPANILEPGVLVDDASRKRVIAQLQKTYRSQGGHPARSIYSLFGVAGIGARSNVLEELKTRVKQGKKSASSATLRIHGLA